MSNKSTDRCVVLVPVADRVEPACRAGLDQLRTMGFEVREIAGFANIDLGRSHMATAALNDGYDELMWIDSDIGFDPHDVDRLRSLECPVACGIYPKRGGRSLTIQPLEKQQEFLFGESGGPTEIRYAAGGFTLVRREVYESVARKCDLPQCYGGPSELIPFYMPEVFEDDERGSWYLTDDFAFCERVRRCGYKIIADTSIRLWHIGKYPYGWEDAGREVERHSSYRLRVSDSTSERSRWDAGNKAANEIRQSTVLENACSNEGADGGQDQLFFVAGLPRSGSTLLMNLLAQNPKHHVTPTSGLIELFVTVKNRWPDCKEFNAEGLDKVRPRIKTALRGLLHGYFEQEFAEHKTVFDKSRGWLQFIEPLEEALDRQVKILVTVRDIRAIVASFEKIYRRRSVDYKEAVGEAFFQCQTIEGRAEQLLAPQSVVGLSVARLQDAIMRGLGNRLVIIPYAALTADPTATLEALYKTLGFPPFRHDPSDVRQVTYENDCCHGMDLHQVRPVVEPQRDAPWEQVLPVELSQRLARDYQDINGLAAWVPQSSRNGKQRSSIVNAHESIQD